jgi:hypothetical protein
MTRHSSRVRAKSETFDSSLFVNGTLDARIPLLDGTDRSEGGSVWAVWLRYMDTDMLFSVDDH